MAFSLEIARWQFFTETNNIRALTHVTSSFPSLPSASIFSVMEPATTSRGDFAPSATYVQAGMRTDTQLSGAFTPLPHLGFAPVPTGTASSTGTYRAMFSATSVPGHVGARPVATSVPTAGGTAGFQPNFPLPTSGHWDVFSEFNRLMTDMRSVLDQQSSLRGHLNQGTTRAMVHREDEESEDSEVDVRAPRRRWRSTSASRVRSRSPIRDVTSVSTDPELVDAIDLHPSESEALSESEHAPSELLRSPEGLTEHTSTEHSEVHSDVAVQPVQDRPSFLTSLQPRVKGLVVSPGIVDWFKEQRLLPWQEKAFEDTEKAYHLDASQAAAVSAPKLHNALGERWKTVKQTVQAVKQDNALRAIQGHALEAIQPVLQVMDLLQPLLSHEDESVRDQAKVIADHLNIAGQLNAGVCSHITYFRRRQVHDWVEDKFKCLVNDKISTKHQAGDDRLTVPTCEWLLGDDILQKVEEIDKAGKTVEKVYKDPKPSTRRVVYSSPLAAVDSSQPKMSFGRGRGKQSFHNRQQSAKGKSYRKGNQSFRQAKK
ncbi:uncharacterized protein LOC144910980 [Branchiostoma floridae x Branchiostoma belcheri]